MDNDVIDLTYKGNSNVKGTFLQIITCIMKSPTLFHKC